MKTLSKITGGDCKAPEMSAPGERVYKASRLSVRDEDATVCIIGKGNIYHAQTILLNRSGRVIRTRKISFTNQREK